MNNGHKRFEEAFLDETLHHQQCQELGDCIDDLQNDRAGPQLENSLCVLANELWQVGNWSAEQSHSDAREREVEVSRPEIEGYEIHELIGRGGMGLVFRATDQQLKRNVAIKVLPANVVGSQRARKRFRVEVQAAAQLEHPGIVPVYAFGEYADGLFYTMREISGVDLARKLRLHLEGASDSQFGPSIDFDSAHYRRWVASIGKQLAEALAHSHEHLIVHRDVKPANVLIDLDGNAMLSDFGLARINEGSDLTGADDVMGTVLYMSPEQTGGSEAVDARTDVYSLGVTLYELLTGQTAITESGFAAAWKQINDGRINRPRQLRPSLEPDLETIVLKSIAPEPSARYASAADMADDLGRFLDVLPIKARRATIGLKLTRWAKRNSQWVTTLGAVASVLLAVIFGLAIYSANKSANDADTIRDQSARMLDQRGVELLQKGDARRAAEAFREAAVLAKDNRWAQRQLRRVSAIEDWSPRLTQKWQHTGRLLALIADGGKVVARTEEGRSKCVLIDQDGERTLFETSRTVEFAQRNASGTKVVFAIGDRTNNNPEIKLFDASRDHLETLMVGQAKRVTSMWFTNDERFLILTGWDGDVITWDLGEKKRVRSAVFPSAENGTSWVYSAKTDHDKTVMVAATNPGQLVAYSLPELKPLWKESKKLGWWTVDALVVSPDGKWVAAGSVTNEFRLWHIPSGTEVALDNTIAGEATVAKFSADGGTLAVGDDRGGVYLWKIPDGSAVPPVSSIPRQGFVMRHQNAIVSLDFDAADQLLVGFGNSARAWRLSDYQPLTPIMSIDETLYSAAWQDDGSIRLRSGKAETYSEWIWQLPNFFHVTAAESGNIRHVLTSKRDSRIEAVVTSNANDFERRFLPSSGESPAVNSLTLPSNINTSSFGLSQDESCVAYIVNTADSNTLHFVDRSTLHPVREPVELSFYLRDARLNADGSKWIANNFNDTLVLGDVASGRIEHSFQIPNWLVEARFVGHGEFAAISWDYRLRIWNSQGSEVGQFEQQSRPELMVVLGNFIVVSTDSMLYVYERRGKGDWIEKFKDLPTRERILTLAISPKLDRILSCGEKGTSRLWSMDGKVVAEFTADAPISDCRFSPDGRWFTCLSEAGSIQFRSALTGELMGPAVGGITPITKLEWIEDSLVIAGEFPSDGFWLSEVQVPSNWSE